MGTLILAFWYMPAVSPAAAPYTVPLAECRTDNARGLEHGLRQHPPAPHTLQAEWPEQLSIVGRQGLRDSTDELRNPTQVQQTCNPGYCHSCLGDCSLAVLRS